MKYLNELREGGRIGDVYLCKQKQSAVTKNGKSYENVILQDKSGVLDAKIWEPNSPGIGDFDVLDYVYVVGDVTSFAGNLQASLKQVRKADEGEYVPGDYLPVSKNSTDVMYDGLLAFISSIGNQYLKALLQSFYVSDMDFIKSFKGHSAAKTVHHGFVGGLLEHTLNVTKMCAYYCEQYPVLNRDLLLSAAMFHDIGKTVEISDFPMNDYTDDGQLLGHIVIGSEMLHDRIGQIAGFPKKLESELKHCILAHHGEYEYGSPKKPALAEAVALNLADNTDARLETLTEIFDAAGDKTEWLGYNRLFESNLRRSMGE
ncbi:MAG: HD domain-containing protein [Lachnospiraceae bacterium]|nr:HD domain-containing protein [Lachnospiraceae bacterium]